MEKLLFALKDTITEAGRSPTSLAACFILVLFVLAYSWFGKADWRVKFAVFAMLTLAGVSVLWRLYAPPLPPDSKADIVRSNYVVDVQYTGISEAEARRIMTDLRDKGWSIYDVEKADGFRPTIVKYGALSNALAAEVLRDDVMVLGRRLAPVSRFRDPRIKPTHLELWVGR